MNTDSPDIHFERGLLLYQQDRHPQAEKELRQALAANPEHAPAHAILALTLSEQGKIEAAAEEAEQAIRLDPHYAFAHYARALVFAKQERNAEAQQAVLEALRLDPTSPGFYALLASIHLNRRNPIAAIEAAEQGLAYDPTHAGCSALRTMALLRLGRTHDAQTETAEALRRDPQDSLAHAGRGWALLHEKQPGEALIHFREALRLDPTDEYARDGLVEALKARYWIYRQVLAFFLWMGRMSTGRQWVFLIGLMVVHRILIAIARNQPNLQPFVRPVIFALLAFMVLTWLADPLFILLLRLNRFGRLVLNDQERRQSGWIGSVIAAGLAGLIAWAIVPAPYGELGVIWAIACGVMLIPLAAIFNCPAGWRRRTMTLYTLGMAAATFGAIACLLIAMGQENRQIMNQWAERATTLFIGVVIAGLLSGWLANGLITLRRR